MLRKMLTRAAQLISKIHRLPHLVVTMVIILAPIGIVALRVQDFAKLLDDTRAQFSGSRTPRKKLVS